MRRNLQTGGLEVALPGMIAGPFQSWMRLVDNARAGRPPDMTNPEDVMDVASATGLGMTGGLISRAPKGAVLGAGPTRQPAGRTPIYQVGTENLDAKLAAGGPASYRKGAHPVVDMYQPGMSEEEFLALARTGQHLQPRRGGGLLGAPNNVVDAASLEASRRQADSYLGVGAPFRHWYGEGQQAISLFSPSEQHRRGLAQGMALMSPNSSPIDATNNAIRMHNRFALTGAKQTSGLPDHAEKYLSSMDETGFGNAPPDLFGRKTGPFGRQLGSEGDAGLRDPRSVNDLWEGRRQGYPAEQAEGTFKPVQHGYMHGENVLAADRARTLKIGGVADWTPDQVQAAGWVGKRFETLKAERDARIATIQNSGMTPAAKAKALAVEPDDQTLLRTANEPINDTLERGVTNVTWEAIPGRGLGHREDVIDASEAVRKAYSMPREQAFIDPITGHDRLYQGLNLYQRPVRPAQGEFTAPGSNIVEHNRAQVSGPVLTTTGANAGHMMQPYEMAMLNRVERLRGGLLGQHGVDVNRSLPVSEKNAGKATGLLYTGDDAAGAVRAMQGAGADALDVGGGQALGLRFGGGLTPREVASARAALPQGSTRPTITNSSLIETGGTGKPGSVTQGLLSSFSGPEGARQAGLLDPVARPIARELYGLDKGTDSKLQALRAAVGDEGLQGLLAATKGMTKPQIRAWAAKRGLPAITVGALLASSSEEP